MKISSILLGICSLLLAVPQSRAADERGGISVQFIRVPGTADDRTALLQLEDDQTLEVQLPTSALSETYRVDKPQSWVLGKWVSDENGGKSFEEMGRVAATHGKRQIVVVIDEGEMNDGKLKLIAMDLTLEADAFQFVNASKHDISGELGIERFGIAPLEHALLKAEASRSDKHNRRFCDVTFSFRKGKEYVKYFDSSWRLEKQVYALIIFHHEATADKLKMTVIRDFVLHDQEEDF